MDINGREQGSAGRSPESDGAPSWPLRMGKIGISYPQGSAGKRQADGLKFSVNGLRFV